VRGRTPQQDAVPTISLTFDDGPHPIHTADVLAELDRWKLTATFFVIGQHAAAHPALIEQIIQAGHAVGNHTWTHSEPQSISSRLFDEEVVQTSTLLSERFGIMPRFMRPPKGELTFRKTLGLWCRGYTVALWSVDPRDYRIETATEALTISQRTDWSHGDVVLLHDNRPGAAQLIRAWGEAGRWPRCRTVSLSHWVTPCRVRCADHSSPSSGMVRTADPTVCKS
jgi:peptidoglycan/xylan/chitin deacetylase (PgdA/CDA1 family)